MGILNVTFIGFKVCVCGGGGSRGKEAGYWVSEAFIKLRLLADVGEEANCWGD